MTTQPLRPWLDEQIGIAARLGMQEANHAYRNVVEHLDWLESDEPRAAEGDPTATTQAPLCARHGVMMPVPGAVCWACAQEARTRMWRDLVTDRGIDQANREWPGLDPERGGPGYDSHARGWADCPHGGWGSDLCRAGACIRAGQCLALKARAEGHVGKMAAELGWTITEAEVYHGGRRVYGYFNMMRPGCTRGPLLPNEIDQYLRGQLEGQAVQTVPVPVLEALASAWEDQAERRHIDGISRAEGTGLDTLAECARMLREAITHGGAG